MFFLRKKLFFFGEPCLVKVLKQHLKMEAVSFDKNGIYVVDWNLEYF